MSEPFSVPGNLSNMEMLLRLHQEELKAREQYPAISLVDSYLVVRSGPADVDGMGFATGLGELEVQRLFKGEQ